MTVIDVMTKGVFNLRTMEVIPSAFITGISIDHGRAVYIEYTHHDGCIGATDMFEEIPQ